MTPQHALPLQSPVSSCIGTSGTTASDRKHGSAARKQHCGGCLSPHRLHRASQCFRGVKHVCAEGSKTWYLKSRCSDPTFGGLTCVVCDEHVNTSWGRLGTEPALEQPCAMCAHPHTGAEEREQAEHPTRRLPLRQEGLDFEEYLISHLPGLRRKVNTIHLTHSSWVRVVACVFLGRASQSSDLRTFSIPPLKAAFPSPPVFPLPFSDSGSIPLFSTTETCCQSGDSALPTLAVLAIFWFLSGNPGPEGSPLHCRMKVLQDGVSLFSQGSLSWQVSLVLCVGVLLMLMLPSIQGPHVAFCCTDTKALD